MSSNETYHPKDHQQNGAVVVEAIQMRNEIVDKIVTWIDKKNIVVHRTKCNKLAIVSIEIPIHGGCVMLRYPDYLVKYPDGGFVVVSKEQFNKRYESSNGNSNNNNISPW